MKKIILIAIVLAASLCFSSMASADWSQGFIENGVGPFDQIGIWSTIGSSTQFTNPGFSSFNQGGWTNFQVSNTHAYALGPSTLELLFSINFLGSPSEGEDFLFMASSGTTIKERARAIFDGSWHFSLINDDQTWRGLGGGNPAPEPISSALFLIGSGALVAARKIRNRK